jgi:hypothetical protein
MTTDRHLTASQEANSPVPRPAGYPEASAEATSLWEGPAASASLRERMDIVANAVWQRAYRPAYRSTFAALASLIEHVAWSAEVGQVDQTDPSELARAGLRSLGDTARRTRQRVHASAPADGAADAMARAVDDLARSQPRVFTRAVRDEACRRGAMDGALEGAREIVAGWRARTPRRIREAAFAEANVTEWLHSTLAAANRQVLHPWLTGEPQGPEASIVGLSFAHAPAAAASAPNAAGPGTAVPPRRSGGRRVRT